ncbi:MAG: response regulator [Nitrospinota bacterium]|nr:response regulator [Nitrospinota bacterium]
MPKTNVRVLLVDDDIVDRKALTRYVKENKLPYEIKPASSLAECRDILNEQKFDIILLDYQLGDGTGIEIMPLTNGTPVVFVTGGGDESIAAEALKLGAYGYLIKDPDQKYLAVLSGTINNVVDRKASEEALKDSETKFRSVTRSANDAIISCDDQATIISWDGGAQNIFGYTDEEAVGQPVTILIPQSYLEKHTHGFKKFTHTGKETIIGRTVEYSGLRKNGSEFPIEMSLSTWRAKEKTFFTAIIRDITERSKFIKELNFAKERAENATLLKDKFLSLVSHDLRSPLGTMLGFLRLLRADSSTTEDEQKINRLANAVDIGENMLKLIEELLDIGRLRTGIVKPKLRFCDLGVLTLKVLTMYGFMAKEKGIKVENEVPIHTRIYADADLIIQVLQNLFFNAIKFCRKGDSIVFKCETGKKITLSVIDTGVGIEPGRLKNLFSYEMHTSTVGTAGETGTGLGLPLCREIMETHGGTLEIESEINKGTSCAITLNIVKPRVLLVDDDRVVRKVIISYLKDFDIDIVETDGAKNALDILEKEIPHLVIIDILMPEMDGFQLTQAIRNDPKYKLLPIIILTSDTNIETRQKAFQLGADDFAQKNSDKNDFIARVRRFVG